MGIVSSIIQFARICRAAGIPVSPAEVLDAVEQTDRIDLAEEGQFRTVLKANFLKNHRDGDTFAKLYDFFFHHLSNMGCRQRAPATRENLLNILANQGNGLTEEADDEKLLKLLARDPLRYLALLLKIQSSAPDMPEIDLSRLSPGGETSLAHARRPRMDARFRELLAREFPSGDESLRFYLQEYLLNALPDGEITDAEKGARPIVPIHFPSGPARRSPANLGEIPFQQLTEAEAQAVHAVISRLARKYKDRITRRDRVSRKGSVDIRRTLRNAARYDGVPMKLAWRRRLPQKPKIVALCDVSYSVWAAVPFMLNILYSLQDCFRQVQAFVFIARVAPVSDTFARRETMAAIDEVMTSYQLHYPRNAVYGDEKNRDPGDRDPEISDYGTALAQFLGKFSDVLDHRTTLIILGDGRCNFLAPRSDLLGKIKEKCRRVVWLNPEPEVLWGDGDSEILSYRPHIQELRPCSNLRELAAFVSDLFAVLLYSDVQK